MSLRIGFDLRRMRNTGIGRYARNVFAGVVAEAPQHHFVAVVQSEEEGAVARALAGVAGNLSVHVAPAGQFTAREMLRTPRLDPAVDVWHSPHPFQWALGARHATVLTLLDLIPVTHAIGMRNVLLREPYRAFLKVACRRAARFVSISTATADEFRRHMGVRIERVHVTHLAPDAAFEAPVSPAALAAARRRWGLPRQTILYVGMSQPHKNLDRLLQAVGVLARDASPDRLGLAIIGPNVAHERAALQARIASLGITGHVHFLNWLSDEDVRLAYHASSVLVQPSLVEGFGLPVLEAMQAGVPVVASDIPSLREVARDAAIYFDPREPMAMATTIRRVLSDARLAASLRDNGARNLWRFSWRAAARETVRAYELAAAARRS